MVGVAALAGYWAGGRNDDMTTTALIAGYQRAALSGQQVDVVSEDRHTVKPWFTAHAPLGALVLALVEIDQPAIGHLIDHHAARLAHVDRERDGLGGAAGQCVEIFPAIGAGEVRILGGQGLHRRLERGGFAD